MSNLQHFGDIILEAKQKYSRLMEEDDDKDYVEALSIVYEVMRTYMG